MTAGGDGAYRNATFRELAHEVFEPPAPPELARSLVVPLQAVEASLRGVKRAWAVWWKTGLGALGGLILFVIPLAIVGKGGGTTWQWVLATPVLICFAVMSALIGAPLVLAAIIPFLTAAGLPRSIPFADRSMLSSVIATVVKTFWAGTLLVLGGVLAGAIAQDLDAITRSVPADRPTSMPTPGVSSAPGPLLTHDQGVVTNGTVHLVTGWVTVIAVIAGFVALAAGLVIIGRTWRAPRAVRYRALLRVLTPRTPAPRLARRRVALALLASHWACPVAAFFVVGLYGLSIVLTAGLAVYELGAGIAQLVTLISAK